MPSRASDATGQPNPWRALAALTVGYFMVVLDMTIVAVANPAIMGRLHAGLPQVIWVSSAYLLTFATLLLLAGRLGDRFGPKNVYLAGLVVFTLASLWCGLSPTIGMLIAARAVQGIGAALVTPQMMAVITRTFPVERRTAAMSLGGMVAGLANLMGPVLGGLLTDRVGWEWIFFLNVPIGVAGLVLAARLVPAVPTHRHRFDGVGVLLSGVGMLLLVFGIQQGGAAGFTTTSGLITGVGMLVILLFVRHERRVVGEPLLPLSLFRDRNFALCTIAVASVGAAVAALLVPLYFYLEPVRVLSGTRAALIVAPMAVCAVIFVPLIGKFGDRLPPRVIPTASFALFAGVLAWLSVFMTPDSPMAVFFVGAAFIGIANAGIWPSLAAAATYHLPVHRAGAGAGVYNAIRQVGTVLGAAAISAVIAARVSAHHLGAPDLVEGIAAVPRALRSGFSAALGESMYLPVVLLLIGLLASMGLRPALVAGRSATVVQPEHRPASHRKERARPKHRLQAHPPAAAGAATEWRSTAHQPSDSPLIRHPADFGTNRDRGDGGQSSVAGAGFVLVSVVLLVSVRGGQTTMRRVASGPRNSEKRNQYQRLRPLVWARPALTRASEPHQVPRLVVVFIGLSCGCRGGVCGSDGRAGSVVVEAA